MKKSGLIVGIVLAVLIVIVAGFLVFGKSKPSSSTTTKATPTPEPVSVEISPEDLPSVRLIPRADRRELTLEIKNLKDIKTLEYELTYLTKEGRTQGAVGSAELNGETSITKKILLGTCSRNVCRYDEGVTNGSLLLRLRGTSGVTKITADFDLATSAQGLTLQGWLMK